MFSNLFVRGHIALVICLLYVSCASTPSDSTEETAIVEEAGAGGEPGLVTIIEDPLTPISEGEAETLVGFENFDDQFVKAAEQSVIGNYLGKNRAARVVIYFDFDSAFLALDGRKALDRVIADIKNELARAQTLNIRVEGHTDERGSNEYNLALGQRRADSVTRYMILQGIAAAQLESISYGETRPASSGSGEIAWQENRRVEINY